MASICGKAISISEGYLNSGHSYLITAVPRLDMTKHLSIKDYINATFSISNEA